MSKYITIISKPRWQCRWWLKTRICKNVNATIQTNGKQIIWPIFEFYCPKWAKPLDWFHERIFGSHKLKKIDED